MPGSRTLGPTYSLRDQFLGLRGQDLSFKARIWVAGPGLRSLRPESGSQRPESGYLKLGCGFQKPESRYQKPESRSKGLK